MNTSPGKKVLKRGGNWMTVFEANIREIGCGGVDWIIPFTLILHLSCVA
jgi:hypothetical protein